MLAALDQRIAMRYAIAGMSAADTADYIRHHCKIAGRADTLFSDDAIGLIHNASPRAPPRGQQPRTTCTDRRVRRRTRHRRRKRRPHRHQRNRRGLNPIHVNPTSTASTRRAPRHHTHHGPAHHTERGRSHIQILINPDDAIIVIFSDAQQAFSGQKYDHEA